MTKQADLTYQDQGLFTQFYPETDQGIAAWNQLAEVTDGTGKVLTIQAKQIIAQLRKAGYSVYKAKKANKTDEDKLLSELNEFPY